MRNETKEENTYNAQLQDKCHVNVCPEKSCVDMLDIKVEDPAVLASCKGFLKCAWQVVWLIMW